MHIRDQISRAKRRIEGRQGAAEGFSRSIERGSLCTEIQDSSVESGELLCCAGFGCVLTGRDVSTM